MSAKIGIEALIPNSALKAFEVLIGKWQTSGTHPLIPGKTFHGRTSFEWIEGGAYVIMHSEIDEPEIPSGVAIFGSDNIENRYFMLYFDERNTSRMYDVAITEKQLTWWRNDSHFSQRFTLNIEDGGQKLVS